MRGTRKSSGREEKREIQICFLAAKCKRSGEHSEEKWRDLDLNGGNKVDDVGLFRNMFPRAL